MKKTKIITFTIAILGLISELWGFMDIELSNIQIEQILYFNSLKSLHLSYFNLHLFGYLDVESGYFLNYFNFIFYLLLLIGAILYSITHGKEVRLIRFVMSIVFISNSLYLVSLVYGSFIQMENSLKYVVWTILVLLKLSLLIYYSYDVLKLIQKDKLVILNTNEENTSYKSQEVSKWQRFLHLVLDTLICILIFSQYISYLYYLGPNIFGSLRDIFSEREIMYGFIAISQLIYYPFFEILLGATPAKLITECRVTDEDGQRPKSKAIFKRTFARYIPFEQFSFFTYNGLHDTISNTEVRQEKRSGVKGQYYFLIIPFFLLSGFMIYWGIEKYNIHQAYQYAKSTHDQEVALIEKRLKNLSTDDIIQIKEKNNYSSVKTYLKVEEIGHDDVIVSLIQKESDYSNSLLPIEQFYINNKNNFSQFPIAFADLIKAYTLDYEQSIKEDRNGVDFLKDGKKYEIVRIERLYATSISNQYSIFSDNENIRLSFKNYGWPGKVISIKSIEGNIKWNNKLPINVLSVKDIYEDSFSLIGRSDSKNTSYKIKMIILDSLRRKQTYLVEGGRNSHTVYQLE